MLIIREGSAYLQRKLLGLNNPALKRYEWPTNFVWSLYSATIALAVVHLLLLLQVSEIIFQFTILWEFSTIKHQRSTCRRLAVKILNSTSKQQHTKNESYSKTLGKRLSDFPYSEFILKQLWEVFPHTHTWTEVMLCQCFSSLHILSGLISVSTMQVETTKRFQTLTFPLKCVVNFERHKTLERWGFVRIWFEKEKQRPWHRKITLYLISSMSNKSKTHLAVLRQNETIQTVTHLKST